MKNIINLLITVALLFNGNLVLAESHGGGAVKAEIKEEKQQQTVEKKAEKVEVKEVMKKGTKKGMEETVRAKTAATEEKSRQAKQELKGELEKKIKDAKQLEKAGRLADKMAEKNKATTDRWLRKLARMSERVAELEKKPRADKIAAAIAAAKVVIDEAKAAVEAQAAKNIKDYWTKAEAEVASGGKPRAVFARAKQLLIGDLKAINILVKKARKAVEELSLETKKDS